MDLIQKLLYGDQPEAQRVDLSLSAPANPWTVKPGEGGVIQFQSDEDDEDRELRESLAPVRKLFFRDDASCASPPEVRVDPNKSERFRFSKQADESLQKRAPKPEPEQLTVKYRKSSDGEIWCEQVDAAGTIKACHIVSEPDDEVLSQIQEQ